MGYNEFATAIFLQAGFQTWSLLYNKIFQESLVDNFNSRAAFMGVPDLGNVSPVLLA